MSFNRISYLESWEHSPDAFRRQSHPGGQAASSPPPPPERDSDDGVDNDEETYQDLPDASISSSFPSTLNYQPCTHRLSFNPIAGPGWNESTVEETPSARGYRPDISEHGPRELALEGPELPLPVTKGAFEVERRERIIQVCTAVVYCLLAAGTVFGFAAIKPVMIKEGVYRHLCSQDEIDRGVSVCYGQELRLNLMFTIAAVATNVSAFPVGTILDTYGPRVCGMMGSCFLATGSLLFISASYVRPEFDVYITGYLLLALGGPFIYISSFHLSNAFPARSGLILSMITGAFDASSALFLGFRLLNSKTGGWFSTTRFFLVYLLVPLFIIVAQLVIMPSTSYKTVGELVQVAETHIVAEATDRVDQDALDEIEGHRQRHERRAHRHKVIGEIQNLLSVHDTDNDNENEIASTIQRSTTIFNHQNPNALTASNNASTPNQNPGQNTNKSSDIRGILHGYAALTQIRTPWFILITLFTMLQMLRINYFVATIRAQYTYLLSSATLAAHLNHIFDILLPLGGIASVPFIGTILTSPRISTTTILTTLVVTTTLIGILGCIPHNLPAAYANIILFVLYRPFYYTAVSDYAAKVFGFQTFGKVYGLMVCLAGVGNFVQPALDVLTYRVFHGNPVPGNLVLMGLGVVLGGALVGFVAWRVMHLRGYLGGTKPRSVEVEGCWISGYIQNGLENGNRENEPLLREEEQRYYGSNS